MRIQFRRNVPRFASLFSVFLSAALLAGCGGGGSDSSSGTDNPPGDQSGLVIQGPEGSAITVPADPAQIVSINATLDLSQTVAYDASSGETSVHFFLKDAQGQGISLTRNPVELRFYVSELAEDPLATADPGLAWNRLIYERGTPADAESPLPGTLTVIDGIAGEYRYTLADMLPQTSNVLRLTARARWRETIGDTRYNIINPVNASYDFLQAAAGSQLAASGADMVDTNACNSCHGVRIGNVGHGGGYTEVKSCNNCHNLAYQTPRNGGEGDLANMIHRIHSAGSFEQLEGGADFSHVTYPQETSACTKCHNDQAPNADLAFTNPTRRNCGSCHMSVNFATGEGHAGGPFDDDTLCTACHQKSGSSINGGIPGTDHRSMIAGSSLAPKPANVPEFNVQIQLPKPANGAFYVAGETPVVTVLLTPNDGGPAVDYTAPADAKGDRDGALSSANLYVYGPRIDAVPVLTTGSTTDPAWDPATRPQQRHSLLAGGSDPQVLTNANGYHYRLMDNIGDLQPGTYMVRFEGADYGAFSDDNYVTTSTAVVNFQVGQAEVEPKVSGDACTNCHGDTRMHLEGAHPHNQPFDTDGCLGCHDLTSNYGDYIGNRVHAIHSQSETGDLGPHETYDWSHVTFPQDPNNCSVCHTNPNANPPVWRTVNPVACAGCHGSDPDASNPKEAIAASHMLLMGADFSNPRPTPGCLVCHGQGKDVDLYVRHNLVNYSVPLDSADDIH